MSTENNNSNNSGLGAGSLFALAVTVASVVVAGVYILKYSGADSEAYYETAAVAEEIAALGGGSSDGAEEVVVYDPAKEGKKLYAASCMACHQATGAGIPGAFPPLAESEWVNGNPERIIRVVLSGLQGKVTVKGAEYNSFMAALGAGLSDKQIAEIITYIRQDFGNASGPVEESLVAEVRAKDGGHATWTEAELAPWAD